MLWIGCVVAIVIGILFFIIWRVITTVQYRIHAQKMKHQCKSVPPGETIFVSVIAPYYLPIGSFLYQLYYHAYCPSRVYVGILYICPGHHQKEENTFENIRCNDTRTLSSLDSPQLVSTGASKKQPWHVEWNHGQDNNTAAQRTSSSLFLDSNHPMVDYERRTRGWKHNWKENIRVYTIHHDYGPCHARSLIESKLYRNEYFYLILDAQCHVRQHWDQHLVREWKHCHEQLQHEQFILTSPLANTNTSLHSTNETQMDHDFCHSGNFLARSDHDGNANRWDISLWPVFDSWSPKTGYPRFSYAAFCNRPKRHYPSMVWCSDVAFTRGTILETDCRHPSWLYYLRDGYTFFMTLHYMLRDMTIMNLMQPIGYKKNQAWIPPRYINTMIKPQNLEQQLQCYYSHQNLHTWFHMVRDKIYSVYTPLYMIDVFRHHVSDKAKLGISEVSQTDEILCKFGSLQEFQYWLSRVQQQVST